MKLTGVRLSPVRDSFNCVHQASHSVQISLDVAQYPEILIVDATGGHIPPAINGINRTSSQILNEKADLPASHRGTTEKEWNQRHFGSKNKR